MLSQPSLSKIQLDHLDRDAVIYVRQSSLMQVRDNTASTLRQYDLVQRALSLGWPQERISVIDQDQAHSGSSSIGRDGFQSLVAEVGLKHCGAILSLEVSRLARSCSDWYHLLEICALTDKVVLDPDEEVQAAVRLVFALFEEYGSALAVVKHFTIHHLRFPDRLWKRTQKGELVWEPLRCGRVLSLLHNPFYAGAYVYGRTKTRRHALPGEAPRIKGRTRQV